ncbi:hypothetical protein F5B21DRAFT_415529 [Xylaria acuta]|nr:hypothetical protein F5B21DRAFT_415529 [Xylaria acuta]
MSHRHSPLFWPLLCLLQHGALRRDCGVHSILYVLPREFQHATSSTGTKMPSSVGRQQPRRPDVLDKREFFNQIWSLGPLHSQGYCLSLATTTFEHEGEGYNYLLHRKDLNTPVSSINWLFMYSAILYIPAYVLGTFMGIPAMEGSLYVTLPRYCCKLG